MRRKKNFESSFSAYTLLNEVLGFWIHEVCIYPISIFISPLSPLCLLVTACCLIKATTRHVVHLVLLADTQL